MWSNVKIFPIVYIQIGIGKEEGRKKDVKVIIIIEKWKTFLEIIYVLKDLKPNKNFGF